MKAHLSRRYHFSASHRLHSELYTAEENRAVFGKCNNPHGHGHNYVLQVTVSGPVDAATGMVCDLGALDRFVHKHVTAEFDHANLNTLPAFSTLVSTTENVAFVIHERLRSFPSARLENIRVEETGNNASDYSGEGAASTKGAQPWKA